MHSAADELAKLRRIIRIGERQRQRQRMADRIVLFVALATIAGCTAIAMGWG